MYFQNFQSTGCCLCGEHNNLTGEHKIKRSALKTELGETELYIGQHGNNSGKSRIVQGTGSKHLKFKARICASCNNDKTQSADLEFDKFNSTASNILNKGIDTATVFDLPRYSKDTDEYLDIFRYFAKLLCCHLAEVEAPCPIRISNFAIGVSNENYINLEIKKDWHYEKLANQFVGSGYVAHGGLTVYGDKLSELANRFHSTLTVGSIQYIFYVILDDVEKSEMKELYPDFSEWCRFKVQEAKKIPMSKEECQTIGIVK